MKTLGRLLRAGFHTALLFGLPWLTGALVGLAFDVREVAETSGQFAGWFAIIVLPLLGLQLVGIFVKVGRHVRAERASGRRGFAVLVEGVDRHVRVLTGRGVGLAVVSLGMVGLALSAKWGQFGILAVAGLGLVYLSSTIATVVSAFAVRAFDDRVRRGRGAIDREMSPTVVDAGDPVEERFFLARVPVPPGFRLHIEEALPERLGGDTRFAVDRAVSGGEVTVSAPLPRTPRGLYRVGPADIWFEDIFGLSRVFVAARATSSLRALPRLRPITFERRPRSSAKSEGPLSVLARLATEEHFRTRPYLTGDDLRRVHWKQSINTGNLMVRVPEAIPFAPTRVRIVLDTFLPPGWRVAAGAGGRKVTGATAAARAPDAMEDVLDLLVESWVGLAHSLLRRGEKVTLVAPIRDGEATVVREIECKRGEERRWRAIGSDAAWQIDVDVEALLRAAGPTGTIIVSAGLSFGAARPPAGTTFVVGDGASVVPDAPADAPSLVRRLFVSDYPVGAEDNRLDLARLFAPRAPSPLAVRAELGKATAYAIDFARSLAAPVVVARRRGVGIALENP